MAATRPRNAVPGRELGEVKRLVESGKADVNAKTKDGQTLLHLAAEYGHLDTVKYVVGQHADVNANNKLGATPLHVAAEVGRLDTVEYLVGQHGADVNAKNKNGATPLHLAATYGNLETVKCLVEQGKADVNAMTWTDVTSSKIAASLGKHHVVDFLVSRGVFKPMSASTRRLFRASLMSQIVDMTTDIGFIVTMAIGAIFASPLDRIVFITGSFVLLWALLIGMVPFQRGLAARQQLWDGTRLTLISYKLYALFEGGIEILVLYALDMFFVMRAVFQEHQVKSMLGLLLMALLVVAAAATSRYVFLGEPWVPFVLLGAAYLMAVVWACILTTADHPDTQFAFLGIKRGELLFPSPIIRALYLAMSVPLILPLIWWCRFRRVHAYEKPKPAPATPEPSIIDPELADLEQEPRQYRRRNWRRSSSRSSS